MPLSSQWLEYLDYAGPILQEAVRINNGRAIPSDPAGSGLAWNHEAVHRLVIGL